ncbi:hypothetical protein [Nostoc sp.]
MATSALLLLSMDTFISLNSYSLNLSNEQAYREISQEELSAFIQLHLQGK